MAKYLIHAVPKRLWYVNDFLIPSMLKRGIQKNDITVYVDTEHLGNLKAFIQSCKQYIDPEIDGCWHLQDDIIISDDFKDVTETNDSGIVCGFFSFYDKNTPSGIVSVKNMWYSFPCIRIPNKIALDAVNWIENELIGNAVYKDFWKNGVNDDWCFRQYVFTFYPRLTALNLNPNIVNHVDYLIGGPATEGKELRKENCVSRLWKDDSLIEELKCTLQAIK